MSDATQGSERSPLEFVRDFVGMLGTYEVVANECFSLGLESVNFAPVGVVGDNDIHFVMRSAPADIESHAAKLARKKTQRDDLRFMLSKGISKLIRLCRENNLASESIAAIPQMLTADIPDTKIVAAARVALTQLAALLETAHPPSRARYIGASIESQRVALQKRREVERERDIREADQQRYRWQDAIRSAPTFDSGKLRVIAADMKKLVHHRKMGMTYVRTIMDFERVAMEFLCQAISAGAFWGNEWLTWRMLLADNPHISTACSLLLTHAATSYKPPDFVVTSHNAPDVFADLIESFIPSEIATRPAPQTTPIAPAAVPAQQAQMPDHQEEVLQALLELKAFDKKSKKTTTEICRVALGQGGDPGLLKRPIAELKRAGYVATREGRGGGAWLTAAGREKAVEIKNKL